MNQALLSVEIELEEAWLEIANPNLSVSEAVELLKELGNQIIKVDHENRRILVAEGQNNG